MKIISYNVNGIRAAMKKGFAEWLQQANPDVICLQEIKALEEQQTKDAVKKYGSKDSGGILGEILGPLINKKQKDKK